MCFVFSKAHKHIFKRFDPLGVQTEHLIEKNVLSTSTYLLNDITISLNTWFCCSKVPSHCDSSFKQPQHIFKELRNSDEMRGLRAF